MLLTRNSRKSGYAPEITLKRREFPFACGKEMFVFPAHLWLRSLQVNVSMERLKSSRTAMDVKSEGEKLDINCRRPLYLYSLHIYYINNEISYICSCVQASVPTKGCPCGIYRHDKQQNRLLCGCDPAGQILHHLVIYIYERGMVESFRFAHRFR